MKLLGSALAITLLAAATASADTTPQTLPLTQDWTNTALINAADDWSMVPGIIGYRGDDLVMATAVDPQTVVADGSMTPVDVNQNITDGSFTTGGVTEMELANPAVSIKGSGTADAPHLVFTVNTTGVTTVRVQYDVRDMDASATTNSIQQVALQYRIGTTGEYTNVPAGFVADATEIGTATKVSAVDVTLPANAGNQPVVQIRVITTNALGTDEYVGIDNIQITDAGNMSTPITATGTANPNNVAPGAMTLLTAMVTPGTMPASTSLGVLCDLRPIGGMASTPLTDDAMNGDVTAGDNTFSRRVTVVATPGQVTVPCTASDAEMRSVMFNIQFAVTAPGAECGNGDVETGEGCDDSNTTAGDGCSATCTVEPGYTCAGDPSVCADVNECTAMTDNCADNATCTNTPGSFTCACPTGYDGDGTTCADIDECTTETDDCDDNATCTNTEGAFTCACDEGFEGDGRTCTAESTCGNGVLDASETCDDGNAAGFDGCSGACAVESGYTCTGTPSVCTDTPDPEPMDEEEGGCCSTSRDANTSTLLLGLSTLAVMFRRRRRA